MTPGSGWALFYSAFPGLLSIVDQLVMMFLIDDAIKGNGLLTDAGLIVIPVSEKMRPGPSRKRMKQVWSRDISSICFSPSGS